MFWHAVLATALLAAREAAASSPLGAMAALDAHYQVRAVDVLERSYDDMTAHYLGRRQAPAAGNGGTLPTVSTLTPSSMSDITLNPDGTLNMTAWDEETSRACRDALSRLQLASNPSGTCICYNLPSLDTATGVFEADLRLFKLSEPTGAFAGIPPQNIQVGLTYTGASVSPVSASRIQSSPRVAAREAAPAIVVDELPLHQLARRNASLELLQAYLFVGMIDPARMAPSMSMAQLEALVMPVLTLTGVNATGATISTNVSSNEAVFVTGVFSKEVVMSDFAMAQAAVDLVISDLSETKVAFVLPGVQILIFPVGLVITSIWLVLGLAAYGYGTYMRMSYAEQFKRRSAVAQNSKRPI